MEYALKNGGTVNVRPPKKEDAAALIHVLSTADAESRFLARNPGEFSATVENEEALIQAMLDDPGHAWFVSEYQGKVVGQCSVGLIRPGERYLHRAGVAFVLLKDYWSLGIGGKMMEECLSWCRDTGVSQVELEVVAKNKRALSMYLNFGFEIFGRIPHALRYPDGATADEYFMVKFLQRSDFSKAKPGGCL